MRGPGRAAPLAVVVAMATVVAGSPLLAEAATPPAPLVLAVSGMEVTAGLVEGGDYVVELDTSGIDQAAVTRALGLTETSPGPGGQLSDVILDALQENDEYYPPGSAPPTTVDFFTYDGGFDPGRDYLRVTISAGDVQAELYGWVIQIIAGALAWMGAVLASAACTAALAANPPAVTAVCPVVQGATTAFLWTLIAGALGAGTLFSGEVWASALAAGIVGAAGSFLYGKYFAQWIASYSAVAFRTIGVIARNGLRAAGFNAAGDLVRNTSVRLAELFPRRAARIARRAGWNPPERATRVLPLGDSVTAGCCNQNGNGYRERLDAEIDPFPGDFDLVGGQRDGSMPDPDNEGHSGWVIDQISGVTDQALQQYRPNVVTLLAGTNDLNGNVDVAAAPRRMAALVDKILASDPNVHVLLARIPTSSDATFRARLNAFNIEVTAIADARDRVVEVDTSDIGLADMGDALHPNASGYAKLGNAFADMLSLLIYADVLASPSQVSTTTTGQRQACPTPRKPGWTWSFAADVAGGAGASRDDVRWADINGDGRDDFLIMEPNARTSAYLNGGPAGDGWSWSFAPDVAGGAGASRDDVRWADINGDGRDDFLIMEPNARTSAYLNGGPAGDGWSWSFAPDVAGGAGASRDDVRWADINGDGRDDFLIMEPNARTSAYLNGGPAGDGWSWSFAPDVAGGAGASRDDVRWADVNGDGRDDFLIMEPNARTSAYLNGGPAGSGWSWSDRGEIASGAGAARDDIRWGDVNGDGRDDFLIMQPNARTSAYLSNCAPS